MATPISGTYFEEEAAKAKKALTNPWFQPSAASAAQTSTPAALPTTPIYSGSLASYPGVAKPAATPAPTAPKTPAPAGAANYVNFALEADGKTVYNVTTGKRYSSEAELAKDLGVAVGQIDWTKIKPSGAGTPATLTSGQYTTPSGAVVDLATGQIITPAPKSEGTSASFLAPPDTTATPTPAEQMFESLPADYKTSMQATDKILQQEHDQNIADIQRNTGYNQDLLTDAYNKSRRDIDKAFEMLGIGSVLSGQKVNDLALASSDLTKGYLRDLTKLSADAQAAEASGNIQYAKELASQQTDYFNFVVGLMQQQLTFEEKKQNTAMNQVSELVSSGGIASLDDASLMKLANQSGYDINSLIQMRQAVKTRDTLKTEQALQTLQLKMDEFDLKQSQAQSLTDYREQQISLREASLGIEEQRFALSEAKATGGNAGLELEQNVDPNTGFMDINTYRVIRDKYAALQVPPSTFDSYYSNFLSPADRAKFNIGKVSSALISGGLTSGVLSKLGSYGISSDLAKWIAEQQSAGVVPNDIVQGLIDSGMDAATAQTTLDTYNSFMQMGYSTPVGG